ncbi:uncharacterized protein BJ212DRAFT_1573114 [Suillus subaureus]|uniref:Uncharacterized protein n=1 Tax=Suillus subaureus TaxID=48587 RepID=A0A9P7JJD1_9AGAM|nr:uncharacterized protein BJ212DRAFT_1573114 [Suillus subaureus]KAG1825613.1 hypothetical protein BJ212DRAFT_1573114 [Suillus subaureus]
MDVLPAQALSVPSNRILSSSKETLYGAATYLQPHLKHYNVGNELTPSVKRGFKFTDYVPQLFCELREDHSSLDPANYLLSLTSKYIFYKLTSPENLPALSAPVLRGVALRVGIKKSDARNKERGANVIMHMTHFALKRTELASRLDDILFKSLLTTPTCPGTWGTSLVVEFQNLHGPVVVTALHTLPVISASLTIDSAATRAFKESKAMSSPWISTSVDDLARCSEKPNRTMSRRRYSSIYAMLWHTLQQALTKKHVIYS